jgi:hypothetical protein
MRIVQDVKHYDERKVWMPRCALSHSAKWHIRICRKCYELLMKSIEKTRCTNKGAFQRTWEYKPKHRYATVDELY